MKRDLELEKEIDKTLKDFKKPYHNKNKYPHQEVEGWVLFWRIILVILLILFAIVWSRLYHMQKANDLTENYTSDETSYNMYNRNYKTNGLCYYNGGVFPCPNYALIMNNN